MALSRLAPRCIRACANLNTFPISLFNRSLSTGPQVVPPDHAAFGKWNVTERANQRPHSRYLKSGKAARPLIVKHRAYLKRKFVAKRKALLAKTCVKQLPPVTPEERGDLPKRSLFHARFRSVSPVELPHMLSDKVRHIYALESDCSTEDILKLELTDLSKKFALLDSCAKEFSRVVVNSKLNDMRTVGDVLEYYQAEPKMLSYFKSLDVSSLAGNVSFNVRREKALGVRDNAIKKLYKERRAAWRKPCVAE